MHVGQTQEFEFRTTLDPAAGRNWIQLTCGDEFCYPLYFYEPVSTADSGTVIFYRLRDGQVQNWKLELATGLATCLTSASTPNCLWRFWDEPSQARGVRELMSAFSPISEEMTYFDGNLLRAVHVRSLADRLVYELPKDRVPCGLPGLSPDGRDFVFPHIDRSWWEQATKSGPPPRHEVDRCHLALVDMQSGMCRSLVVLNSWLTHANFLDDQRILFVPPATESGVMLTDRRGGWYTHLRTQNEDGIALNHAVATAQGIQYETISPMPHGIIGRCDPDTLMSQDYRTSHPIAHVGHDWEGRLWFGDIYQPDPPHRRHLAWLPSVNAGEVNPFSMLTRGFEMFGNPKAQRCHVHASLMPDRRHILFTGPDPCSRTNHLFLLDVADLADVNTAVGAG